MVSHFIVTSVLFSPFVGNMLKAPTDLQSNKDAASGAKREGSRAHCIFLQEDHEQVCLKALKEMWEDKQLCDIRLTVGDVTLEAHRAVLAATVPYFKTLFSKEWNPKENEVVLKDMNAESLQSIVSFVYTGEVEIATETVEQLLVTAKYLHLPAIVDACVSFITRHLSCDSCVNACSFAQLHGLHDLLDAVTTYIVKNFGRVVKVNDFIDLSFKDLKMFISMDNITVAGEEEVFLAVTKWLQHNPSERSQHAETLFDLVRFPTIPLRFLKEVVSKDPIVCISQASQGMLKEAMEYHQNPSVISFISPKKTQPRSSFLGHICLVGGINDEGAPLNQVDFFIPNEEAWREGTKMNTVRSRFSLALCNGFLYAMGGSQATSCLSAVERYSPKFDVWEPVAPMNTSRRSCAAVVVGGRIFVLGGMDGNIFLRSVEVFTPVDNSWVYQPAMLEARSEHAAVFHDAYIYAIGGNNSHDRLSRVERFDIINRQWHMVGCMTVPRSNFGAVLLGQEIFVCGGQSASKSEVLSTAEVFNSDENVWEEISAKMTAPRVGLAVVSMGNKVYALGGSNGSQYLDSVECYDPSKQKWLPNTPLRFKRFAASAVVLSKMLLEQATIQ